MSAREESIRIRIETIDDLSSTAEKFDRINDLLKQQTVILAQSQAAASGQSNAQIQAINGVTDALRKQQSESDKAGKATTDSNDKAAKSFEALNGQVRNFATLVGAAFSLNEIKSFGLDIIEAKTKIDSVKISLDTMIGSKRESADLYANIVKLAAATPFTLQEISEQVGKLKAYNIETSDLIPTITSLGNIAAAVGKEKLPQLTLAYGQVANSGRLMGTELKQFVEAGVPLLSLIATSYGKTREEVNRMAADHEISFDMVRKAIMDASAEGGKYQDLMVKLSKTVGGSISNLADSFFIAKGRIGDFFETQIREGTEDLQKLITAVAGSSSAIERSVAVVKSVASAYVAYTVATKAQNVVEGIAAAYQAAKTIAYGQYLIALRAVTGQQVVFTAAETEAVVAAEAFNVAMKANWIGLAVTAVVALVSAMYAYKAVTTEVSDAMGEQEIKLKSEQSDLEALTRSAINATEGTKERKKAIELLIQKYPDYFAGLDTEKTTNNQLRTILESVNKSYQDRIALAREAYRADGLKSQQQELFKQEKELFDRVKETNVLNEEVIESFGGSAKKLLGYMKENGREAMLLNSSWDTLFKGTIGQAARDIAKQQGEIESETVKSTKRINEFTEGAARTAIDTETKKHEAIMTQLKDGSKAELAEVERYNIAVAKLDGTYQEKKVADLTDHTEKVKQITLLSAKEIAIIKGESNQAEELDRTKQLQNQLAFLNKQEDAEIESINKITVNRKISASAVAALHEEARIKGLAIDAKYDSLRAEIMEQLEIEEQKKFLVRVQESNDKVAVLTAKRLEAERMLTKLNDASTNDERLAALKEYNQKFTENLQQQGIEQLKIQLDNSKKALDDIVAKNGEKGDAYRSAYAAWLKDNEKYNTALTQQAVTAAKDTAQQIQKYEKDIQDAHKETAKLEEDTLKRTNQTRKEFLNGLANLVSQDGGFMGQIGAGLVSLYNSIDGMQTEALKGAKSALKTAQDTLAGIKDMYDGSTAEGAAAIAKGEQDVAKAKGAVADAEAVTVQGVLGVMGAVYGVLSTIAAAYNNMVAETYKAVAEGLGRARQAYADFNKFVVDSSKSAHEEEMANFTGNLKEKLDLINGYYDKELEFAQGTAKVDAELAYNQKIAQIRADAGNDFGKFMEGMNQAQTERNNQSYQLEIANAQQAITRAKEIYDTKVEYIDDELARFKAAEQEKVDALNRSLDAQKAATNLFYSDKQLRLQADDVYRKELLDSGEARETAALEAAKQREIQRAITAGATAEEIERITTAFNKLIADKHAEYQTAMGDKSKEISLANAEAKAQETDKIAALEKDTAAKIADLQKQIVEAERNAANQKIQVNQDYASAVQEANRQIFEANKAMKIAELNAEIAILNSKRSWTGIGNGKINDAINDINAAIAAIAGTFTSVAQQQEYDAGAIAKYVAGIEGITGQKISIAFRTDDFSPINSAFDAKGNPMQITFNGSGKVIKVYDASGNRFFAAYADGFVPATGEKLFKGSPYVDGLGYPDGRDTVPAMINKGERVLPTADNIEIGGRALSNKELVHKVKFADLLLSQFPNYQMPGSLSGRMRLPDGIMNASGGNSLNMGELTREMQGFRRDFRNFKPVSMSIDRNGTTISEIGLQSKINRLDNIFTR